MATLLPRKSSFFARTLASAAAPAGSRTSFRYRNAAATPVSESSSETDTPDAACFQRISKLRGCARDQSIHDGSGHARFQRVLRQTENGQSCCSLGAQRHGIPHDKREYVSTILESRIGSFVPLLTDCRAPASKAGSLAGPLAYGSRGASYFVRPKDACPIGSFRELCGFRSFESIKTEGRRIDARVRACHDFGHELTGSRPDTEAMS